MLDELIEAALEKFKRGGVPGNVAAVLDRSTRPNDLDGLRWRFYVASGDRVARVEADLSGSEGGSPGRSIDSALLEAAVERRIARRGYRSDRLIDELVADERINLRKEDLRLHPSRDGEGSVFF